MNTVVYDFDATELAETVRNVALETPNFVYDIDVDGDGSSCLYFKDDEPSCVVGHALAQLGISFEEIRVFNSGTDVENLCNSLGIGAEASQCSMDWLVSVQKSQDDGESWGTAVFEADFLIAQNTAEGLYED